MGAVASPGVTLRTAPQHIARDLIKFFSQASENVSSGRGREGSPVTIVVFSGNIEAETSGGTEGRERAREGGRDAFYAEVPPTAAD